MSEVFASRPLRFVATLWLLGLLVVVGAVSCSNNTKAVDDLPETEISTVIGHTDVIVNADKFPNFAHACWMPAAGVPVGFWSTTDRVTLIIYNDHLCEGSTLEAPMTVLSGNPRDVVNAGG